MKIIKRSLIGLLASISSLFSRNSEPVMIEGEASYYAKEYLGKKMANGQPYNPHRHTMATWDFPLGSIVKLEYTSRNGVLRTVICEVTDRGPAKSLVAKGRRFDLSYSAFRMLENPKAGVIRVTAVRMK